MAEQEIRFTEAAGRRVAWARTGAGPPLVLAGWWMAHLDLNWRDPRFRAFVGALGLHRTVIRYDPPGTGLSAGSGTGAAAPTLEGEVAALAAVVAAADATPVDLVAASSGAPVGLAFAATHPRRVRRLVVYGGYARGSAIADERRRTAIADLVRAHWGLGSRALADVFMPGADAAGRAAFAGLQRAAATADQAARSLEAVYRLDAGDLVAEVAVPTVVLHRRDDRAIPFALGRDLAAALPQARLVALDGADHFPWSGDVESVVRATLDAVGVPVGDVRAPDAPAPDSGAALTRREAEVLALIAGGLSDREVAERLVLSPHTVHRHVANVRTKLGLPTRAAAVAAAARRGLL